MVSATLEQIMGLISAYSPYIRVSAPCMYDLCRRGGLCLDDGGISINNTNYQARRGERC